MDLDRLSRARPHLLGVFLRLGRALVNGLGSVWKALGGRLPGFVPEALLAVSRRDVPGAPDEPLAHSDGLTIACESIETEGNLGLFGRLVLRQMLRRSLANAWRLRVAETRDPARFCGPIPPPIFIVGLPRSGTTFLQRLVSSVPGTWGIPLWMSQQPLVLRGPDLRRLRSAIDIVAMGVLAPDLDRKHAFELDAAEEAITLFDAAAGWNPGWWRASGCAQYLRWLLEQDPAPGYQRFATVLRGLAQARPDARAVLKTPNHMGALSVLHDAFPDAVFVQTHRDPARCVASYLSLQRSVQGILTPSPDLHRLGATSLHLWATHAQRGLDARARCPQMPVLDVDYDELVGDPMGVLQRVCAHAGLAFDARAQAAAAAELARRPRHRHGTHTYRLEDYGLDTNTVHGAFPDYIARHLPGLLRGQP